MIHAYLPALLSVNVTINYQIETSQARRTCAHRPASGLYQVGMQISHVTAKRNKKVTKSAAY